MATTGTQRPPAGIHLGKTVHEQGAMLARSSYAVDEGRPGLGGAAMVGAADETFPAAECYCYVTLQLSVSFVSPKSQPKLELARFVPRRHPLDPRRPAPPPSSAGGTGPLAPENLPADRSSDEILA